MINLNSLNENFSKNLQKCPDKNAKLNFQVILSQNGKKSKSQVQEEQQLQQQKVQIQQKQNINNNNLDESASSDQSRQENQMEKINQINLNKQKLKYQKQEKKQSQNIKSDSDSKNKKELEITSESSNDSINSDDQDQIITKNKNKQQENLSDNNLKQKEKQQSLQKQIYINEQKEEENSAYENEDNFEVPNYENLKKIQSQQQQNTDLKTISEHSSDMYQFSQNNSKTPNGSIKFNNSAIKGKENQFYEKNCENCIKLQQKNDYLEKLIGILQKGQNEDEKNIFYQKQIQDLRYEVDILQKELKNKNTEMLIYDAKDSQIREKQEIQQNTTSFSQNINNFQDNINNSNGKYSPIKSNNNDIQNNQDTKVLNKQISILQGQIESKDKQNLIYKQIIEELKQEKQFQILNNKNNPNFDVSSIHSGDSEFTINNKIKKLKEENYELKKQLKRIEIDNKMQQLNQQDSFQQQQNSNNNTDCNSNQDNLQGITDVKVLRKKITKLEQEIKENKIRFQQQQNTQIYENQLKSKEVENIKQQLQEVQKVQVDTQLAKEKIEFENSIQESKIENLLQENAEYQNKIKYNNNQLVLMNWKYAEIMNAILSTGNMEFYQMIEQSILNENNNDDEDDNYQIDQNKKQINIIKNEK